MFGIKHLDYLHTYIQTYIYDDNLGEIEHCVGPLLIMDYNDSKTAYVVAPGLRNNLNMLTVFIYVILII